MALKCFHCVVIFVSVNKCCTFTLHSKNHVADFTSAKTYSPRLSKSTKSKILLISAIDFYFSRSGIAENARLRFGVFMLKSVPSGRGFESWAGQLIIFQIKYTRDVKSMIRVMESKQKDIRRWSMTIYIDSMYQKRKICDMVF
jgi:hypothetical protein